MNKKPDVKPGDWILIGNDVFPIDAVVCKIYEDGSCFGDLEVVYMDESRAINDDVVWSGTHWKFSRNNTGGGYAYRYDRLREFVEKLELGRERC